MSRTVHVIGNGDNATMYKPSKGIKVTCNIPPFEVANVYTTCLVDFKMMKAMTEGSVTIPGEWTEDQGHPNYVEVKDPLLVMDILEEDEKSTKVLLDEASEVSNNLYSLHHNSYNTAYTDEKYNEIMNEIKHLLEIDNTGDWESKTIKNSKGEEKTIYNYIIEVTKFIPFLFSSIFNDDYVVDDYRNAFDYYGDFEDLTKEMITEEVIEGASMSRSYYDYADHTLVQKYLNDMFIDYI